MIKLNVISTTHYLQEDIMCENNVIQFPVNIREKNPNVVILPEGYQRSTNPRAISVLYDTLKYGDRKAATRRKIIEGLNRYDLSYPTYSQTTTSDLLTHLRALHISGELYQNARHLMEGLKIASQIIREEVCRINDRHDICFGDSYRTALYLFIELYRSSMRFSYKRLLIQQERAGNIIQIEKIIRMSVDELRYPLTEFFPEVKDDDLEASLEALKTKARELRIIRI